jgi:hypothetical protein
MVLHSVLYLRVKSYFFKNPGNFYTFIHGSFEHCGLAGIMHFPGQNFGFCRVTAKGLDELADNFLEGMNFVIEQDYPRRRLYQYLAVGNMFGCRLLRQSLIPLVPGLIASKHDKCTQN